MAELTIKPEWSLRLTHQEMGLVLRALGGRLTESDAPLAVTLGDKLTGYKLKQMQELGDMATGMTKALTEKGINLDPK